MKKNKSEIAVTPEKKILKKNLPAKPSVSKEKKSSFELKNWIQLAIILIGVFIIYSPTLKKEFINFDDNWYIYNNPLLNPFSFSNIGKIFTEFYLGQYSPLPTIFLGLLSHISGNETFIYNLAGIMLHLVNICLVCWLVYRLTKNSLSALLVALLFGVCTLNVESVAWASAVFKIGLYSIFSLSAMIAYTFYLSSGKIKYQATTLAFFVLSFLSKEQAVALVLSLFCIDYFYGRDLFSKKVILEKLPLLVLSIACGIITLLATKSFHDELSYSRFSFLQRILYDCYALGEYVVKLFLPYELSAYYPYPEGKELTFWFYIHPLIIGAIILLFILTGKNRSSAFGILFFGVNLLFTLALQVVSVRGVVMADRYVYLSSVGIFFLVSDQKNFLWRKKNKPFTMIFLGVFIVFISAKTYSRCSVWKNSMVFWNDVISKYQTIPVAYINRSELFLKQKSNNEALDDLNKAIALDPDFYFTYNFRGIALYNLQRYEEALRDYNKAIALKPDNTEVYNNRGMVLTLFKKYDEAIIDFNKTIELRPKYPEAYFNRGIVFMNQLKYDEALADFSKAIELQPNYPDAYVNKGNILRERKIYDEALSAYDKAVELKPGFPIAYFNRGTLYKNQNKNNEAIKDYNKAIESDPNYMKAYNNLGIIFFNEKKYEDAISNYSKAIKLNKDFAEAYYNRALSEYYSGKKGLACADVRQAASLGYQPAADAATIICQ